jgi:CheY-like chemotaxis protein
MKIRKMVLIDNSDIDNFVNTSLVRSSGLVEEIVPFQSATEGLKYMRKIAETGDGAPQLILLDLGMQIMDGFGFMEEFLKLPPAVSGKTKIIVLTSSLDANDKRRSKAYPFVLDLLEKPLKVDALRALVEKM